jgi:hypothetical protein
VASAVVVVVVVVVADPVATGTEVAANEAYAREEQEEEG